MHMFIFHKFFKFHLLSENVYVVIMQSCATSEPMTDFGFSTKTQVFVTLIYFMAF